MKPLLVTTSGKGESLLALHGWGMNSAAWENIRSALEQHFTVTWIDFPGYGKNIDVEAKSLDDIVNLIIPLVPENSHIMGWSLGGLIAQAITQKTSKRVKSLTLITSTLRFSQAEDWTHAMNSETLQKFSNNLKVDLTGTLKRFIALQFMGIRDKKVKVIQRQLINQILSQQASGEVASTIKSITTQKHANKGEGGYKKNRFALKLGLQILNQSDFRKVTEQTPQHWLFAEKDKLVPIDVINDLKLIRPNAQITLLKNAGHAPFMTHPDEFIASILPFLKNHA